MVNINHHHYTSKEGIIEWDIKSYYAYLPATFIYHDLSLDFIDTNPKKFKFWIWPVETPTGKKAILTSMGLSYLYAPFFAIGHVSSLISDKHEPDGYSEPYHTALQFSTYIYFLISLVLLMKILRNYFSDRITALTLFAIAAGTNLFYYITYSAAMPHGYNFFLIILFIFYLEKWIDKINIKYTIILGLVAGLIALIRPTNIVVLFLVPLWKVGSINDFKERINLLLKKWPLIVLMALAFILVWVPQFAYWKCVSGKIFYFTYGERSDQFFWGNPQIWKILFSYEKGWFVYTPMMLLAVIGFWFLHRRKLKLSTPVTLYVVLMVYILSAWWCWWYGGSFGQRSMIDFYGLMAIPLAAFFEWIFNKKWLKYFAVVLVAWLVFFNQFNIKQYRNQSISYWWMNKEGYWENFLKVKPTCKYWNIAMHPNYKIARLGIYEPIAPYNKLQVVSDEMLANEVVSSNLTNTTLIDSLKIGQDPIQSDSLLLNSFASNLVVNNGAEQYFKKIKVDYYVNQIHNCASWKKDIEKQARKNELSYEEMALIEAERIYNNYSQKYDQR